MYKLDLLDRKILFELDRNSRQFASQIAKKCRAHRNVINFRINRLVDQGVIREFVTMIRPSALGLTPYKFYLQLQNLTKEKEQQIEQLSKSLPIYWMARVSGRWDYIIGILAKDNLEAQKIKNKIFENIGEEVVNKSISSLVEAPHYYRTYLLNKKEISPVRNWLEKSNNPLISEPDLKILHLLANNSRIPVTEISQKINLNVKTVLSRIKRLEKEGVIYDYRISINLEKIGYKFFKSFITLKNDKKISSLLEYCRAHPNIIHVTQILGEWDLEPEFEMESEEKFQQILMEIREKFSEMIQKVEVVNILKEYSYVCLPK